LLAGTSCGAPADIFGSLVSRVAVTNTYKEIAHLSKSPHPNLGDFSGI